MSLHQQDSGHDVPGYWYAFCFCGVVGPLRRTRLLAALDEGAHADACSTRVTP